MTGYRYLFWPIIVLASIVAVWVGFATGSQSPLRPFIAFWFLLVCPGMAYMPLLRLRSAAVEFVLGIALSIAIGTVVSEVLVLASAWNPGTALAIVIVLSFIGVAFQVGRSLQRARKAGRLV